MRRYLLIASALLVFCVTACGSGGDAPPPTNSAQASVQPTSAPAANAGANQVTVTGAVNQTYDVQLVQANKMPGDIRIYLGLELLCDLFINIPFDTPPGAYPIATESKSDVVFAQYNDGCHSPDSYPNTNGTLTLTATGDKWSGTFKFTGQNREDPSKKVEVTGSFSDVPLQ
jgi:hypothetical protein